MQVYLLYRFVKFVSVGLNSYKTKKDLIIIKQNW